MYGELVILGGLDGSILGEGAEGERGVSGQRVRGRGEESARDEGDGLVELSSGVSHSESES